MCLVFVYIGNEVFNTIAGVKALQVAETLRKAPRAAEVHLG